MRRLLVVFAALVALAVAAAPARAASAVTVNDVATITGSVIVVSGTYSCTATETASLGVTLRQGTKASKGGTNLSCPATAAPWTVNVPRGLLSPGTATATVTLTAPFSGNSQTTEEVLIV